MRGRGFLRQGNSDKWNDGRAGDEMGEEEAMEEEARRVPLILAFILFYEFVFIAERKKNLMEAEAERKAEKSFLDGFGFF